MKVASLRKSALKIFINRAGVTGSLGKGKIFNNLDPEFRSIAVVGLGREGAGFNELEMLDEGMVSKKNFDSKNNFYLKISYSDI